MKKETKFEVTILSDTEIDVFAFDLIRDELKLARKKYNSFTSTREGFMVLQETNTKLHYAIRMGHSNDIRQKAVQAAAMAIRFLSDLMLDNYRLEKHP